MYIIKRNGMKSEFDGQKIIDAILKAGTEASIDNETAFNIGFKVSNNIEQLLELDSETDISVVEDIIEEELMALNPKIAKKYILYREKRRKERKELEEKTLERFSSKWLPKEFLRKYINKPDSMTDVGRFTYLRTYSREIPELSIRESWWMSVARVVNYSCKLQPNFLEKDEPTKLFDYIYNLKVFPAGRTLWLADTKAAEISPTANFNCSFMGIRKVSDFGDLMYLASVGTGIGISVSKNNVRQIEKIRANVEVINKNYTPVPKNERTDVTQLKMLNGDSVAEIIVGDSKNGWRNATEMLFKLMTSNDYKMVSVILINYNNIRPEGEKLKTFGGTSSGPEPLAYAYDKIKEIIDERANGADYAKLKPIDVVDISCHIGNAIISGGARRVALSIDFDVDEIEVANCKNDLYILKDGKYIANEQIKQRSIINNSILYDERPERKVWKDNFQKQRYTGEPGILNRAYGEKRLGKNIFEGTNPCREILLPQKGFCNLVEVIVAKFVDENGNIDYIGLQEAFYLVTRMCYRIAMIDVSAELPEWNEGLIKHRLLGVGMGGIVDFMNKANLSEEELAKFFREMRQIVHDTGNAYADLVGDTRPTLMTTVKPSGTISLVADSSAGVHAQHSEYYIRRIRINRNHPLVNVVKELGYNINIENGETEENFRTYVVDFPVKAPKGKYKGDYSAMEQMKLYKLLMENYVDHNVSITVHVRDNEWDELEEYIYENWDEIMAVSTLSYDNSFYPLLPYEECSKEVYEEMKAKITPITNKTLSKYEDFSKEIEDEIDDPSCATGACPIR